MCPFPCRIVIKGQRFYPESSFEGQILIFVSMNFVLVSADFPWVVELSSTCQWALPRVRLGPCFWSTASSETVGRCGTSVTIILYFSSGSSAHAGATGGIWHFLCLRVNLESHCAFWDRVFQCIAWTMNPKDPVTLPPQCWDYRCT